ncbi:hypothetical protein VC83_08690 [Pseudogymnoascus destructans]|uniref:Uncharacterized protein n=1 Tax=Pseudogymnoascus destructans TaxID=655981 RepID=A0A176ZYG5_9PEZI|nr:uncharacterized protein VC83_08690 [Pseudogymnoascus destructans]OAF54887.1 hypothetical protein VC83_08690 [Pseudogymnoascus destructans]
MSAAQWRAAYLDPLPPVDITAWSVLADIPCEPPVIRVPRGRPRKQRSVSSAAPAESRATSYSRPRRTPPAWSRGFCCPRPRKKSMLDLRGAGPELSAFPSSPSIGATAVRGLRGFTGVAEE